MRIFEEREIFEAYEHADLGGQALHLHPINQGHPLFRRYPVIAHLFDQDRNRLIATAKSLGVRVIKVERADTPKQHIDLCGKPLEKAKLIAEREGKS